MSTPTARWLDTVLEANASFRARVRPDALPVQRTPGSVAVITCMDPRVNLEAIGIPGFAADGGGTSPVRVIRTIGARAEARSLVIGMFLAGIREIAVLVHTDCGCSLAHARIDAIVENLDEHVPAAQLAPFRATIGEPFRERLRAWLGTFEDPREAARAEAAAIKALPFAPLGLIVHGLVYDLASARVEVVVDGYAGS
jgi:carbonic anhydrase